MSARLEWAVAASVLAACAALSPPMNASLLAIALLAALGALPHWRHRRGFAWAALAATGASLGAASYGIAQLVFGLLAWRRGSEPAWLGVGALGCALPLLLASRVLSVTGWTVEASAAMHFAGALSLAFLLPSWGVHWLTPMRGWMPAAVLGLAGVTFLAPVRGWAPVLPAHLGIESEAEPVAELRGLLRRRAAGERGAGYEAAAHWLMSFGADADTLRFVCPRFGAIPARGDPAAIEIGMSACAAVETLPERALELLGEDPRFGDLVDELQLSLGRVPTDAPRWLRAAYGRASFAPADWNELNERMDFQAPRPPKRRGLRGMGPGKLLVAPAHDLGGFALTTVTKRGGHGYFVDVPVPRDEPAPRRLRVRGVSRRGLRVELVGTSGERLLWGCGLSPSKDRVPMPRGLCEGRPGTAELELDGRLGEGLERIRLRGEFALATLSVS